MRVSLFNLNSCQKMEKVLSYIRQNEKYLDDKKLEEI